LTATLTQTLPASATGTITLTTNSTWSDGTNVNPDTGTFDLSSLNCAAPVSQTIAGHIYLCNNSNPTNTEQSGGTLAAGGTGLTTVGSTPNPLGATSVTTGDYTMTATPPTGYVLVACSGSSVPNGTGTSATESVTVPSGGAGVGVFYVAPVVAVTQTIAGDIYLCNAGAQSTTDQNGGTLAADGTGLTTVGSTPNQLAATSVTAGDYMMTATPPTGYVLVACSGSSSPNGTGTSATDPVTVPSGGAGVGVFYVTAITQTIAGHIYLCNAGAQSTTEQSGGTLAAGGTGLTTVGSTANPLAATSVTAGDYTMTATPPTGYVLVACSGSSVPNGTGTSATESVTVPSGGAGVGDFYVTAITQTIAGHIYLCNAGAQSTTEQSGGTLAAGGTGLTTVGSTANPLAATSVTAGDYTMTATPPTGYVLVGCSGSSVPNGTGTSATESVTVPSGGAGVGVFYVALDAPAITLLKTASIASFATTGTPVTYSYLVTNTGNVTLNPVVVTDPMVGLSTITCPDTMLAPQGTETCSATYVTTQGDLNVGSINNTGTATGTPPTGPVVTAQSSVTIPAIQSPTIALVKSATQTSYSGVGQTINYNYLITNTGNVTLSAIGVTDAHSGLTGLSCPDASLVPAASETCTASYLVTQGDLNAGSIVNTATAQGTPPGSTTPISSPPSSVTIPVAAVSILKQVCGSASATDCGPGGTGPWSPSVVIPSGNTAYWRITVTNTGQIALTGVTVSDPLVAACSSATSTVSLAIGASFSIYCSSADVTTNLTNVATAGFTGQDGPPPSSSAQATVLVAPVTTSAATTSGPTATAPTSAPTTSPAVSAAAAPPVTG
jgi:uncharacterized repeat protein (TIGR01451 family)